MRTRFSLIGIGILFSTALLACEPEGSSSNNNVNNTNNSINNINNASCTSAQDDKLTQIHWLSTRIYNGIMEPGICLAETQQLAVAAILSQDSGWSNICSGTLVSDTHVLTAAHCVISMFGGELQPSELRVAFGEDANNPLEVYDVVAIHSNPDYDMWGEETGLDHAILELSGSPMDALDIEPIPISYDAISYLTGNYVQQVGYGTTKTNHNNTLRWWTVELVDSFKEHIGEMRVNGQGESSVCDGDSGGPSITALGGTGVSVIGTVSWGDASCVDYDHYAMTTYDMDFLTAHLPDYNYCAEYPLSGTCDGTRMARWCEGGILHSECCDEITGPCAITDGIAQCGTPRETCSVSLDFKGICAGNVATWCFNGHVYSRNCSACDQECVETGNQVVGTYCVTPTEQ